MNVATRLRWTQFIIFDFWLWNNQLDFELLLCQQIHRYFIEMYCWISASFYHFSRLSPLPGLRLQSRICIAVLQCRPWERTQVEASLLGLRRTPRSYWSPPPFCPPHSTGGGYSSHPRRYCVASSHPLPLGGTRVAFWRGTELILMLPW